MIAVVVPTIRPESMELFVEKWLPLIERHKAELVVVYDGDKPMVVHKEAKMSVENIMGQYADLIYNLNDGVRNLGFAYVARHLPDVEYIITLDDDVLPLGDTIWRHLEALRGSKPVSWLSTATEYTRGFPYNIRDEAEVVLSHGVWGGVKDYDAPTQLVRGNPNVVFYEGPIPKGIYYPMCGMNLAFKRKMLPYMYWAPMGPKVGIDRFADIWAGIVSKRIIDEKGWAAVTGYSAVIHNKASNVFKNLRKEARAIELNEGFWKGEETDKYFKLYKKQRKRWEKFILGQ